MVMASRLLLLAPWPMTASAAFTEQYQRRLALGVGAVEFVHARSATWGVPSAFGVVWAAPRYDARLATRGLSSGGLGHHALRPAWPLGVGRLHILLASCFAVHLKAWPLLLSTSCRAASLLSASAGIGAIAQLPDAVELYLHVALTPRGLR